MRAITTTYRGATDTRGARIIARSENARVSIPPPGRMGRTDDQHGAAALALCAKMGWTGRMVGGGTEKGMVWVFVDGSPEVTA